MHDAATKIKERLLDTSPHNKESGSLKTTMGGNKREGGVRKKEKSGELKNIK